MARRVIFFLMVCVLAWAILYGIANVKETDGADNSENLQGKAISPAISEMDVIYSARYALKRYLRTPGSARFPSWPDRSYRVIGLGNDAYVASGEVTAKNAFGVNVRNRWYVRLRFTGRDLNIINIS